MKDNKHRDAAGPAAKKARKAFLFLRVTGIVLFIVVLIRADLGEIWSYLKDTDLHLLFLGIFFQLGVLLLKGVRWHVLVNSAEEPRSWKRSLGEFFESYAMGVITPGRMGELLKAGYENHRTGIIGSGVRVIVERGFDIGFFLLFAGFSLSLTALTDLPGLLGWALIAAGTAALMVAFLLLLSRNTLLLVSRLLIKARILKEPLAYRERTTLESAVILLLSATGNFSYFVSCYFLALAVGIEAGFLFIAGGVAIAGFINMLPVTVMGLGTREVTFLYVFNEFIRPQVLAFSGLVFLVAQIGGGLVSLLAGELLLLNKKPKEE